MGKRKTRNEFIEKANLLHKNKFDYSEVKYKNKNTPVMIICPIHGEFLQTPYDHLRTKYGCPKCNPNRKLDTQLFIELSNNTHGDKYDYSKVRYINKNTKVCIICPDHGEFWQRAEDHYNGHGCRKCYNKKFTENQTFSKDVFLIKAKEKFGDKYKYDLSQYKTLDSKIKITCPYHGEYLQRAVIHLKSEGCPKCGRIKANTSNSLTQSEFINKCKSKYGDKFDYSKTVYTRLKNKIIVICRDHGEFETTVVNHLYQQGCCPRCILKSQSELLDKLKIVFPNDVFTWEFKAKWLCRQRIDICLEKYKIGIEYDGIQHYFPVDHFGGEERFKKQIEDDALKNKKCKENGFTLFRVKYNYTNDDFYELCVK